MLTKYVLKMPHSVFSGEDALGRIPEIFAESGVKHLAVFTDKGIEGAGLLDLPMAKVRETGVEYTILDDLPAEPTYMEAQKLVDQCKEYGADFIMAVGGGSVMDTAKLASILMTDEYGIKELLDTPGRAKKCIPTLMIPTTAGTGSE
ncbi:MAG: iron-containing alcohol dehydrogenase, partial [Oscillospiraceae bacterium]|nr:iron-containing alcohol dehydrogenase [Oscillospiraceae bacterium]